MSVYSSPDSDHGFSAAKTLEIVFSKLAPFDGDKVIHDLLQVIYRVKPECFQVMGGIHNSADGKETYLSVRCWVAKGFYHNIHIYGLMRGSMFKVSHMTVIHKEQTYRVNFQRPVQSGGGGGYSHFAADKCPW